MLEAITNKSFRRSDTRQHVKRGQTIKGSENYIRDLERIGIVREVCAVPVAPENKAVPHTVAGAPSSASQAAPVLPQTRLRKSKGGAKKKRKKRAASSSSTRVS